MTILPKSKKSDSKKGESKKNVKPNSPNKVETGSVPSSSKQHAQQPLEAERPESTLDFYVLCWNIAFLDLNSDDEHCEGFRDDEVNINKEILTNFFDKKYVW